MSREDAARPLLQGVGQKSRGQEAGVDQKSPQMSSLPALPAVLGPCSEVWTTTAAPCPGPPLSALLLAQTHPSLQDSPDSG